MHLSWSALPPFSRYSTEKEITRCSAFSRTPHAFLSACSSASLCALYASRVPERRATIGRSAPHNSAREPRRSCSCCREQRGGILERLERGNEKSGSHPGAHRVNSHAEKMPRPESGEHSHAAAGATDSPSAENHAR